MANPNILQEKAVEAIVIMNAAIINLRLYPPTNMLIVKTIDRLYDMFQTIFAEADDLLLAEAEKILLISGEPLSQKNMEKPQLAVFLMLMTNRGFKSVNFNKNLDKRELSFFLEFIGKKPDGLNPENASEQLAAEEKMPHIRINQKIYVEQDKDHQIVANLGITDQDIVKYITDEMPEAALDEGKIRERAKDPEWALRIFKSGLEHFSNTEGSASNAALSENMIRMLHSLDNLLEDADRNRIGGRIADDISNMDADFIASVLARNMDGLFENNLFDQIVNRIDSVKFKKIAEVLDHLSDETHIGEIDENGEKPKSIRQAYMHLMNTDRGREISDRFEEKHVHEKAEKENRIGELLKNMDDFIKQLEEGNPPENDVLVTSDMLNTLYEEGEIEIAEAVIGRLVKCLQSDRSDVRAAASGFLADIFQSLGDALRSDVLTLHEDGLLSWIKREKMPLTAFGTICMQLMNLARSRILIRRYAEGAPVFEAFRFAESRPIEKDDRNRSVAAETLKEAASADVLQVLLEEFRTNRENQRNEAGRNLVLLAEYAIDSLLDLLSESGDSEERVLVLNLISEMGPAAAPAVVGRIKPDSDWYVLRNIAWLLGRVGREEHARNLAPLLVHEDIRVRREALKGVNGIGGALRGEILLKTLSECDDRFKAGIVTALGSLKYRNAVMPLVRLFKSKLTLPEETKIDLQEAICAALGNIGDREALPLLTEVGTHKGLFGFSAYHSKVRAAATRAANMLAGR